MLGTRGLPDWRLLEIDCKDIVRSRDEDREYTVKGWVIEKRVVKHESCWNRFGFIVEWQGGIAVVVEQGR
jgi:hypothetical protein